MGLLTRMSRDPGIRNPWLFLPWSRGASSHSGGLGWLKEVLRGRKCLRIPNHRIPQQAHYKCRFLLRALNSLSGVRCVLKMLPLIQTEGWEIGGLGIDWAEGVSPWRFFTSRGSGLQESGSNRGSFRMRGWKGTQARKKCVGTLSVCSSIQNEAVSPQWCKMVHFSCRCNSKMWVPQEYLI